MSLEPERRFQPCPLSSPTQDVVMNPRPHVLDIRRTRLNADIENEILQGLSQQPLQLPSLLLWNDAGLDLFNVFASTPAYYLQKKELEILGEHAEAIAEGIPSGSVLIELGCGNLQKTGTVLSALERLKRHVRYYALDVSPGALSDSLEAVTHNSATFKYVSIHGLLGTYEDCVAWLTELPFLQTGLSDVVTFLWMGNSIANYEFDEAGHLLAHFVRVLRATRFSTRFILAIDACQQKQKIFEAYDQSADALSNFIGNGLQNANTILKKTMFHPECWTCTCTYDIDGRTLRVYHTPIDDIELELAGRRICLPAGTKIQAIMSGKWPPSDVQVLAKLANLSVLNKWCDRDKMCYFYSLQ